jgi:hypothetical protein
VALTALRQVQWGRESTRGTAQTTAGNLKKLLVEEFTWDPDKQLYRPEIQRASLSRNFRTSVVGQEAALSARGALNYQDAAKWLSLAVKGGITPVDPDPTSTARTWTFDRGLAASNAPESFTFEGADDSQAYRFTHAMVSQLELTYAIGEPVMLSATLFSRYPSKETLVGSVDTPTVVDVITQQTKIYVNNSWATLGDTEKSSLLTAATIRLPTGIVPQRYADGSLDFSTFTEQRTAMECEFDFIHNADGIALYDDYAAQTLKFIRLETIGEVIEAALTYTFRLDMAIKFTEPPRFFRDFNGQTVVQMRGETFEDPTNGTDFEAFVQNNLTSIATG